MTTSAAVGILAVRPGRARASGTTPAGRATSADPDARARSLAALLRGGDGVGRIGVAYLAVTPEEGDVEALVRALAPPGSELARASSRRARRAALLDAVRHDFAAGRVVELDGWRIARTEGRVCALWALQSVG